MGSDFEASWANVVGPQVTVLTSAAQLAAARNAAEYLPAVLAETGLPDTPAGALVPRAFAGTASDGRALDSLLHGSVVQSGKAYTATGSESSALAAGQSWLDGAVMTQVADAGRGATSVGIAVRPGTGYVRMLNPPSCSRCAVLAGRWYRYSAGFDRHPRCDCVHVPSLENIANDVRTDPDAYFRSLSKSEQDRIFTNSGAQAIRDGADMGQVVNARRGAAGLSPAGARVTDAEAKALRSGLEQGQLQTVEVHGHQVYVTTEGTTKRGLYGKANPGQARLMPESIYQIAEDQAHAIELLHKYGYITTPTETVVSAASRGLAETVSSVENIKAAVESPPVVTHEAAEQLLTFDGGGAKTDAWQARLEYEALGDVQAEIADLTARWTGPWNDMQMVRQEIEQGMFQAAIDAAANGVEAPTLYRGMYATDDATKTLIASLTEGSEIDLRGLSSFTPQAAQANVFGGGLVPASKREAGRALIMTVRDARGLPIEGISRTPYENEWLLTGRLRITSVTVEDGVTRVEAEWLAN